MCAESRPLSNGKHSKNAVSPARRRFRMRESDRFLPLIRAELAGALMLDLAQAVREQIVKETPPRKTAGTARGLALLRKLRNYTIWITSAAVAVALAVLAGRSQVGAERLSAMFHPSRPQQTAAKFDAE